MTPISPIRQIADSVVPITVGPAANPGRFADYLKTSMETVEEAGKHAQQSAERFLNGEGEEIHQVALAVQKAELSFELFMQVRNKVVQAYQEVMRTQL